MDVTMFLPASLNLPKKLLTESNAPVIPFFTAFLTLSNALLTMSFSPLNIDEKADLIVSNIPFIILRPAFKRLDIMSLIPDSKLDTVLFIVSQAPRQSPVIICITVLIMPFTRLIAVSTTALITFQTDSIVFFMPSQAVFIIGTIISKTDMIRSEERRVGKKVN